MMTVMGENKKTQKEVREVELVRPAHAKGYWQGISHADLLDTVFNEVRRRKWKMGQDLYTMNADGTDLAAAFNIEIPTLKAPQGQTFSMGLLTSNARRKKLKIVVGSVVKVCHNGMVTGEIALARKHTKNLSLKDEIEEALNTYIMKAMMLKDTVSEMQRIHLGDGSKDTLLMQAGRLKVMPWSRVGMVDEEYRHPKHEEFKPRTVWSLFNAFTEVVKQNPPLNQMNQINAFRELVLQR